MTKESTTLSGDGPFALEARHLGKSARTRARLMDAAVEVFGRDGFEAASVNEIARLADVANGTFYVHFRDKDEIAGVVAMAMGEAVAGELDAAMADLDDAVERAALATRRFIDIAAARPDWGWALIRAGLFFRDLRAHVTGYLRADLERGVRQGVFNTPVDDFLIDAFNALTTAALLARLRGEAGEEAGSRIAELQLRMLGVEPARAREAAWRPLPPPPPAPPPLAQPARRRRH